MATLKKIGKRKFSLTSYIRLLAIGCFFLLIYTSIFVRAETVNLNAQIQDIQEEIDQIDVVNESLQVEISKLASYQNIFKIAQQEGLANQKQNIVTIADLPQ